MAKRDESSELLRELVAHLRQNRTQLREEWVGRISETRLLTAMTKEEIFAEATSVYDSRLTQEIFPSASFRAASKRMKLSVLFSSSATCWRALFSQSIRPISRS